MLKKSMIIKLHIQIANKQLNVYNNTIITSFAWLIIKKENRFPVALRLPILKKWLLSQNQAFSHVLKPFYCQK